MLCFFFVMIRRPPRFTRTDTRVPYTTLFRSAFGRRDMVLAAGLNVGRCLHLADVARGAVHRDTARQDAAVLAVEVAQISLVPFGGEVGRVRIPVEEVEGGVILPHLILFGELAHNQAAAQTMV